MNPAPGHVAMAVGFVLPDTGTTLLRASWWPARPGPLAWAMLGVQAAACLSLVVRRRARSDGSRLSSSPTCQIIPST